MKIQAIQHFIKIFYDFYDLPLNFMLSLTEMLVSQMNAAHVPHTCRLSAKALAHRRHISCTHWQSSGTPCASMWHTKTVGIHQLHVSHYVYMTLLRCQKCAIWNFNSHSSVPVCAKLFFQCANVCHISFLVCQCVPQYFSCVPMCAIQTQTILLACQCVPFGLRLFFLCANVYHSDLDYFS